MKKFEIVTSMDDLRIAVDALQEKAIDMWKSGADREVLDPVIDALNHFRRQMVGRMMLYENDGTEAK